MKNLLVFILSFCPLFVCADPVDIGDGLIHGDGIHSATNPYWLNPSFKVVPGGAAWGCTKTRNGRTEDEWLHNLHNGFNVYRFYWMPPQPSLFIYDVNSACNNWDILTLRENGCTGCITHYFEYFPQEHGWRYVPIEDYGYGAFDKATVFDLLSVLSLIGLIIFFSAGMYLGNLRFWY